MKSTKQIEFCDKKIKEYEKKQQSILRNIEVPKEYFQEGVLSIAFLSSGLISEEKVEKLKPVLSEILKLKERKRVLKYNL